MQLVEVSTTTSTLGLLSTHNSAVAAAPPPFQNPTRRTNHWQLAAILLDEAGGRKFDVISRTNNHILTKN
ncbi:hypothetical protein TNIN_366691 [Trichonephila inaurata madagascariensis]|uniref:Uncharacterized protein n=1 Tax=Trichonephila inaurata madagascariensis TaxID=2747483 RepID=A0A8X6IKD8_9ARAC|nr:hypothetical protein TNIN_366691 [Trichonephila inaurata madagascariensis]